MRLFLAILSPSAPAPPFLESTKKLRLPKGTVTMHSVVTGDFAPAQREILFAQALDWGADYILALDDDIALHENTLLALNDAMSKNENAGIVGAVSLTRGELQPMVRGTWDPANPAPTPVDGVGFACALIRASILPAFERPYFASQVFLDTSAGRAFARNEDYLFCERVRTAGYGVLLHAGVRVARLDVGRPAQTALPDIADNASSVTQLHADVSYIEPAKRPDIPTVKRNKRTIYLHAGIHKTGTTSIQMLLTANAIAFATVGIHIPYAGRPVKFFNSPYFTHHNLAWELNGYGHYDSSDGGLDAVLAEITHVNAPTVVLTSEDFEFLHTKPVMLAKLADGLKGLDYDVRVILYLRAQSDYSLAIYNEHSKAGHGIDPKAYFEGIAATGVYEPKGAVDVYTGVNRFAYLPLIDAFADAFGNENLIVRAYRSGRPSDEILKEFLALIGGSAVPFSSLVKPGELNVSPSFIDVLNGIYAGVVKREAEAPSVEQLLSERGSLADVEVYNRKFDVLTEAELQMLLQRFGPENIEIERRYGAQIPFRTERDLRTRDASAWEAVHKQRELLDYAVERWKVT
jgi:hypothetical protein